MKRRLRVLTIGHSYGITLNRAVAREVAQDPDFEVTAAAPEYFYGDLRPIAMEPEPEGSPLRLVPLAARCTRYVHFFWYDNAALKALIQKGDFDVVYAWEEPYIVAGYQIARALRNSSARFSFWTMQNYNKRYPPPFDYFERSVLARSQAWVSCASLVHETMLSKGYPEAVGRMLTLHVDLSAFRPLSAAERAEVHQELGLTAPVVGFVGRLTQAKGLDVLMQAMERIDPSVPWNLLLLGSGEYESKIHNWAAARGWQDRVKIRLAKHSEVPRYLGSMDVLVAPSQTVKNWREQFGRMIIEAFACGVPVIGSDSGEIPNVIGQAGRIVPEADISGLAKTIEELLTNPGEREDLARRGLARAPRYSVPHIAQQHRELYQWLASQPLEGLAYGEAPQLNHIRRGTK
jgi:glycosyltransferase involved in cell wall biosynthesis